MRNKLRCSLFRRITLQLCFPIILFTACVSIQKNYLGTQRQSDFQTFHLLTGKERDQLNRNADSLLQIIVWQKQQKKPLKANYINQLYSCFGIQLNHDRYYHSILQTKNDGADSLKLQQPLAAVQLLSSASVYENSYQKNPLVRRAFNRGESGNQIPGRVLQRSRNYLYDPAVRKKITKLNAENYSPLTDSLLRSLPKTNYLKSFYLKLYKNNDRYHNLIYSICHAGSYAVGNSVGVVHGKSQHKRNATLLLPKLQPFDIILMKSPHHLTDKLIPGYFGHAAIWLGPELIKMIIPENDQKRDKNKSAILEKSMVEALRKGVKISSLDEFTDGEDFLVLRLKELSESRKNNILININKQLQKCYDFNFDIESPNALSCTELIFLTFDFIDWQVRYTWSRFTISPDDLPATALRNDEFEFPAFIQNGKVTDCPDRELVKSLMELPGKKPAP